MTLRATPEELLERVAVARGDGKPWYHPLGWLGGAFVGGSEIGPGAWLIVVWLGGAAAAVVGLVPSLIFTTVGYDVFLACSWSVIALVFWIGVTLGESEASLSPLDLWRSVVGHPPTADGRWDEVHAWLAYVVPCLAARPATLTARRHGIGWELATTLTSGQQVVVSYDRHGSDTSIGVRLGDQSIDLRVLHDDVDLTPDPRLGTAACWVQGWRLHDSSPAHAGALAALLLSRAHDEPRDTSSTRHPYREPKQAGPVRLVHLQAADLPAAAPSPRGRGRLGVIPKMAAFVLARIVYVLVFYAIVGWFFESWHWEIAASAGLGGQLLCWLANPWTVYERPALPRWSARQPRPLDALDLRLEAAAAEPDATADEPPADTDHGPDEPDPSSLDESRAV